MIAEQDKLPWLDAVCVIMPQLPYVLNEVRRPCYRNARNLLAGFCHAASEAVYHLSADPLEPWVMKYGPLPHQTHWFLRHVGGDLDGRVLDVTASQYSDNMLYDLYSQARRASWGCREPSRRAQVILDRVNRAVYFPRAFHEFGLEDMTPDGHPWHVKQVKERQRRAGDSNTSRQGGRHA